MVLDTEIDDWETQGDIEWAISEPNENDRSNPRGNIYIRGTPDALKDFLFAFYQVMYRTPDLGELRREFEQFYEPHFKCLREVEARGTVMRHPEGEINMSCERFYLRASHDWDQKVRPNPVLDYLNRFIPTNFLDMEKKFRRALEIFGE